MTSSVSETSGPTELAATAPSPVRDGHWQAVTAMASPGFREIVELFDADDRIGGTYFRIVEKGFQPVDLDPLSDKPLIGVGGIFAPDTSPEQVGKELDDRVAVLAKKRLTPSRSAERQIEARAIRSALSSGLRLSGFPANLRFITGQWRIDFGKTGRLLDVVAVDLETGALVVIELKAKSDTTAKATVSAYAAYVREHADAFGPYFSAMATAMAELYGCRDMPSSVDAARVTGLAAWPAGDSFKIIACP